MYWIAIGLFLIGDIVVIRRVMKSYRAAQVIKRNDFERRRQQSLDALHVAHRFERTPRSSGVVLSMPKGRAS